MSTQKTALFLGATGGVGFSALRRSLQAGHRAVALCRTPSKLSSRLPAESQNGTLTLVEGNAHHLHAVLQSIISVPGGVDTIVFSIGVYFSLSKFGMEDPTVCEVGIKTVLSALAQARAEGKVAPDYHPRIIALSSTGISDAPGRDIPLAMVPLYHWMLKVPHKDKKAMETALIESGEPKWTIVRPSFYVGDAENPKGVRAGKEDPVAKRVERKVVGYAISREDVGKWIFENLVGDEKRAGEWERRVASITN
ncbi:hypothetical protein QBC35DRAFT_420259 [Podospora australis]|uniref:NAD(P)-binding domain-containing protein n=1 Tax=Podospora australis TaxID=1536484 RepID=A0AAN6WIG8_9PEZI|nr:hypothetical protein QBC35DRAFT_420259 [Podospora australis]